MLQFDPLRVHEKTGNFVPHRRLQKCPLNLRVAANPLATKPIGVGATTSVVNEVFQLTAGPQLSDRLAVVGIATFCAAISVLVIGIPGLRRPCRARLLFSASCACAARQSASSTKAGTGTNTHSFWSVGAGALLRRGSLAALGLPAVGTFFPRGIMCVFPYAARGLRKNNFT